MTFTLACIVCGEPLPSLGEPNHPKGAVVFTSQGNFGSGVFDPGPNSDVYLVVNICDGCMLKARAKKQVAWVEPQPCPAPKYEIWGHGVI